MTDPSFVPSFLHELPQALEAARYAARLHGGQRRESDAAPFVLHPLEVAALLYNTGHPEPVVAAGILHDTLEDTDADKDELRRHFGDEIADIVAAMTEDPDIGAYDERKADLRRQVAAYGHAATAVYTADKVAKVRELRSRASHEEGLLRSDQGKRKLDHYLESLEMLEERAAQAPLVRQLRFELEALRALPPAGAT